MSTCVTDQELRAWMAALAPTPDQQLTQMRRLLEHAKEDGMSVSDRTLCRRALAMLEEDRVRVVRWR